MKLIEGVGLSNLCDYSFGDQSGSFGNLPGHFMKPANLLNLEFVEKVLSANKEYITLFIDNIRLYKREIVNVKPQDRSYVNSLMNENDLLELCSNFPNKKFIIFTNLEDTPIDDYIFDKIPDNVLSVNAVNALSFGGKVNPIPYGLQRRLNINDNRIEILSSLMNNRDNKIENLLYVNHSVHTNPEERSGINELFLDKSWAKVEVGSVNYTEYLTSLSKSKFMICPVGNAVDCHRNWECLYMRRVPIMKKSKYFEYLLKDYPVLFVNNYSEVTEELLVSNKHLFDEMQDINLDSLDIQNFYDMIVNDSIKKDDQSS
jgi:hypothetical protein